MALDPQAPSPAETRTDAKPADAVSQTWVDSMPGFTRPYLRLMRLDRPIGTWLLFWPCVFGLALGAATQMRSFPDAMDILLCGIGAIVMRGAGCTYNDIVDRDIDARVARTRGRPIPSGAVSVRAAILFACALSLLGLVILLQFNRLAVELGIGSLLLIAIYPFMKRITWWPQAWLGLTFNWGVPLGFAAQTGRIDASAWVLYAGCFFWTLGYDTIYAHQDKEDDALIGVKSSARRLGQRTKPWLIVFYAVCWLLILTSGWMAGLGIVFALALFVTAMHFVWQGYALDIDKPLLCLRLFRANRDAGALIAVALILGMIAAFSGA
jgi:4-hydroxybenzoate polyprenyltransferase